jgi:hypothetical protein
MAKAKKFTFKKEKRETGLASIGAGDPPTDIKLEKKIVGTIVGPTWRSEDNLWRVRLMKKSDAPEDHGWKWTTLKATFENEPAARVYLNENFDRVVALGLHQEEPYDD